MRHNIRHLLLTGLLVAVAGSASAQNMQLGVNGGVSQPVGPRYETWNTGFSVGATALSYTFNLLGLGVRFGYNRWTPDAESFEQQVSSLFNPDVSGATTIIEFLPTARVHTFLELSPVNFFGQASFGLFLIQEKAEVTGTLGSVPVTAVFNDGDWLGRWGFSTGGGISLGNPRFFTVDIFPLYNIVFTEGTDFQYFTGNLGVTIGF
jgi:hypothetical protein